MFISPSSSHVTKAFTTEASVYCLLPPFSSPPLSLSLICCLSLTVFLCLFCSLSFSVSVSFYVFLFLCLFFLCLSAEATYFFPLFPYLCPLLWISFHFSLSSLSVFTVRLFEGEIACHGQNQGRLHSGQAVIVLNGLVWTGMILSRTAWNGWGCLGESGVVWNKNGLLKVASCSHHWPDRLDMFIIESLFVSVWIDFPHRYSYVHFRLLFGVNTKCYLGLVDVSSAERQTDWHLCNICRLAHECCFTE